MLSQRINKVPGAHILITENAETAARFPIQVDGDLAIAEVARSLAEVGVRIGLPYCRYDDPSSSARPEIYAVGNPFHRIRP